MTALALTCFVLSGLLVREMRRRRASDATAQLARECMRDAVQSRDALVRDYYDTRAANVELMVEIDAWRREDAARKEGRSAWN